MSLRFLTCSRAVSLVVIALIGSRCFGQVPEKPRGKGNDPERPVRYVTLQEAYEMAMKNDTVGPENRISAEQLRLLKPLTTGGVSGGAIFVPNYSENPTDARISALFEKAAVARKAGKFEVARAYYESIHCLCPETKHANNATWHLDLLKTKEEEATHEHFGRYDEKITPPRFGRARFWFLEILTPLTDRRALQRGPSNPG